MVRRHFACAMIGAAVLATAAGCAGQVSRDSMREASPPFGGPANIAYAETLWAALTEAQLVGKDAYRSMPYEGTEPHGVILATIEGTIEVDGHSGTVIVKNNFGGEGVTKEKVANDPDKWLGAVTVMFQREAGYDPDNQNWFWAKYLANGTLDKNPKGIELAGRVAKGADVGCIACHSSAPGGDYLFIHD